MQATELLLFVLMPLSVILIMVIYVRARKREGTRPFEITSRDKKEFEKVNEYTPAKVVARFLCMVGSLFILATFYPSEDPMSLGTRFECLMVGVLLFVIALWLAKPRQRPRWWWAVMWGIPCSASFILLFVCLIIIRETPVSHGHPLPNWLLNVTTLAVAIGVPSAILCLVYCIGVFIDMRSEKKEEIPLADKAIH
jgi:choline-glycine betaine transporter